MQHAVACRSLASAAPASSPAAPTAAACTLHPATGPVAHSQYFHENCPINLLWRSYITDISSLSKTTKSHLSVLVLGVRTSNFQKLVAIKLYISELKYNLEVFTVQMLDED